MVLLYMYMLHLPDLKFHDLTSPMVWHNLMKTTKSCDNHGSSCMILSQFMSEFYSYSFLFHLSCMLIVNFINLNVFWSCTMHSVVSWHHCRWVCLHLLVLVRSKHRFHCFVLELTITVFTPNVLFYKILYKVFWYHNMLTTHSSENPLVQPQPGYKGAGLGRCNLYYINHIRTYI
jgi:hypothetical protein